MSEEQPHLFNQELIEFLNELRVILPVFSCCSRS